MRLEAVVMWLSGQSGRFWYQRSAVRIQKSLNFYFEHYIEKKKINIKRGREWPIFKTMKDFDWLDLLRF